MALSVCGPVVTGLHDQELTRHGDAAFPIACYEDELYDNSVAWHWHDEWEFVIVHGGTPDFFLENRHISIHKGEGIFINGKALHSIRNDKREPSALHSCVFHPRIIGGNTDSVFWQSFVQPFMANASTRFLLLHPEIPWEREALDHFEAAWKAMACDREDCANYVRYELSAAVGILIRHNDFSASNMSEQELVNAVRIRTMLEYIEEHYNDDITIEVLAKTIMVSPSATLRCFRRMLHTTPMQYIKQLRIKKSADLLLSTNKSAKEIAMDCGFNDISYYIRAFKEIYHKTPGEYRKHNAL